jgi:hypothetical protein
MARFLSGISSRIGDRFSRRTAIALALALSAASYIVVGSQADSTVAPTRRIASDINDAQTFVLRNNIHPAVVNRLATDQGEAPGSQRMPRMSIHFSFTPAQQSDLSQLLADQQNRRSPQYRKFLSPEEFAVRFGLAAADLGTVARWLENRGFSNIQPSRARTSIRFSGTASQAQSAFHTRIHQYSLNGETHLANTADPELPKALESITQSLGGLNNFRVFARLRNAPLPQFTASGCAYCNSVAPDDWETIYNVKPLYGAGLDGSGVSIAVIGQSDIQISDLRAFRLAANLPPKDPTVVIPTGDVDPGIQSGDEDESDLDLEWAGAIAKNANIVFVTASPTVDNGITDSIYYAIDQNLASIITISYSYCETQTDAAFFTSMNNLFAQAAVQGITVVAASGDNGGAACDQSPNTYIATHGLSVSFPASSPYVTGIGGTVLSAGGSPYWSPSNNASSGSALSYIPEGVWNDGFNAASGGGASMLFPKPAWQQGVGVPNDGWRDVPDLAFAASPRTNPILYCGPNWCVNGFMNSLGALDGNGGTSAGTPSFAGVLALLVQKTGAPIGNINPNLYSLAQISNIVFHDVTYGGNWVACTIGTPDCDVFSSQLGYSAGVGYDQTTGWGSIDANNFVEQWSGDIALTANPTSLTVKPGTSVTSAVTITPQNNFTGSVSLTCSVSSSLIDVTCSVPSTAIDTSGTATVTITATNYAHTLPWIRRVPVWPAALLAALFAGAIFSYRRFLSRSVFVGVAASLSLLALFLVSCGGGSSGAAPASVPTLALTCSLPTPKQGLAFSGSCSAVGGVAPYTYSVSSGGLPFGLTLNSTSGAITGTPTNIQSMPVIISVSDSENPPHTASQSLTGFSVYSPLTMTCPASLKATAGVFFDVACNVDGGVHPLTASLTVGSLPPGLTMSSIAEITGIPTKAGANSFTITSVDSAQPPQSISQASSIVVAPPLPLSVNLSPILTAQANVPYSQSILPFGGIPPYTYAVTAGGLPAGLSLNPTTGIISGMPQMYGSSAFTLTVQDSQSPPQTASTSSTFEVSDPPPVSGTVTVTATSGSIVNTVTISVAVPAGTHP